MKHRTPFLSMMIAATVLFAVALPVLAQHEDHGTPTSSSFQGDWWWGMNDAQEKLVALANATPQEKYSWRPAEGIRSTSEVFVHAAMANFMIGKALGLEAAEGVSMDAEKTVTDKADVIALLKRSFDYISKADTSKMNLDDKIKLFGRDMSKRQVLFLIMAHAHEHLGQSIAYARSNGVVPPWSK